MECNSKKFYNSFNFKHIASKITSEEVNQRQSSITHKNTQAQLYSPDKPSATKIDNSISRSVPVLFTSNSSPFIKNLRRLPKESQEEILIDILNKNSPTNIRKQFKRQNAVWTVFDKNLQITEEKEKKNENINNQFKKQNAVWNMFDKNLQITEDKEKENENIEGKENNQSKKLVRPSGLVETIKINPNILDKIDVEHKMQDYAKGNFKQHKRGILRREIKIENLLSWSQDIKGSLLNNLSDKHQQIALDIFRDIKIYTGEREKRKKNVNTNIALSIAKIGGETKELRDEIYCQIIKQVTLNPSLSSTVKGWELLAIIVGSFPCSSELEPYVRSYLHSSATSIETTKIPSYAAYCMRCYNESWKVSTISRMPTRELVKTIRNDPFVGALFGGSLADMMMKQRLQYPNVNIPRILAILCDAILTTGGQSSEGIFRIRATSDSINQMKVLLEREYSDISTENVSPYAAACVLKQWFGDLKNPIIPNNLYHDFIKNNNNINRLSSLIYNQLPEENRNVLFYLIRFIRIIANPENQKKTRMNLQNFGIIFSPNLFRCPNICEIMQNTKIESNIMELIFKELQIPESIPGVYE